MKKTILSFFALILGATQILANDLQQIYKKGAEVAYRGPEQFFTGDVIVEPLFPSNDTNNYGAAYVTFAPAARSAWHTHPAGQSLIVISGTAWTQEWNGKKTEAFPGDAVWCPAGVKHWHGASPDAPMTHLAITGVKDGKNVEWMEKVSDEQYQSK